MGRGGPPKGMKTRPVRVGYFRRFFAASSTECPMGLRPEHPKRSLRPTKGDENGLKISAPQLFSARHARRQAIRAGLASFAAVGRG